MSIRTARLLDPERVVLFDGAMGTMLYAKGVFINQCYDELNLRAPDLVRDVHRAYVKAGAEVLETNTFGANRLKLTQYGLETQVRELNRAAARDRARGSRRRTRSSRAPSGRSAFASSRTARRAPTRRARSSASRWRGSRRAASICSSSRRSATSTRSSRRFAPRARSIPTMPVIAQMTIGADGRTPYGATPEDVARALDALGADVIGLNCSVGPQTILEAIEKMAPRHAQEAERAAERRHAARRRRPQHVHGEPRVHGDVRAPSRAGGREDRRRMLRHDAGAHPGDGRGHSSAELRDSRDRASGDRDAGGATRRRRATATRRRRRASSRCRSRERSQLGGEDRARRVRDVGRDRAAARRRCDADARRRRGS